MTTNDRNRKAPKGKARASGQGGWVHVYEALPAHLVRMARVAANDGGVHLQVLPTEPTMPLPVEQPKGVVGLRALGERVGLMNAQLLVRCLRSETPYFVFSDEGLDVRGGVHGVAVSCLERCLGGDALGLFDPRPVPAILHFKQLLPGRWNTAVGVAPIAHSALPDTQFLSKLAYAAFNLDCDFEDLHATILITTVGKYKPYRITLVTS